jgi:GMP synthase (glutamine-hydrolysing)
MRRVLLLQHVWDNAPGYVGTILQRQRISFDVVQVETEAIPDLSKYSAVVALGGPQHVYEKERHPYFVPEQALIRQAVEQDIPYLGICLGGQLLADVLGGRVSRHTLAEVGFSDVQFTEAGKNDPLYKGLPGYQKVVHWHKDFFDLPSGAILLASNAHTMNQAFRYGKRAYGLQYHIEVDPQTFDIWLYDPACRQELINTLGIEGYHQLEAKRPIQAPIYQEHTRIMFENFLKISELMEW